MSIEEKEFGATSLAGKPGQGGDLMGRGRLIPAATKSLEKLATGNKRFADNKMSHPEQSTDRRKLLDSEGQNPFAVILGCSDSRIPPEVLFDQGLGDLFVIRVAGNIIDEVVLASIEYAAAHLATPLIVVLGHSKCGAVAATIAGGEPEGHLPALAALIEPAIRECSASQGDLHHNVELANVRRMTNQLREATPILAGLVQDQTLSVIGAYYDQETGLVDWLDD